MIAAAEEPPKKLCECGCGREVISFAEGAYGLTRERHYATISCRQKHRRLLKGADAPRKERRKKRDAQERDRREKSPEARPELVGRPTLEEVRRRLGIAPKGRPS